MSRVIVHAARTRIGPANGGMFLKPSLMLSPSSTSEHPAQAAKLIDVLINDPEVGEIFGMSRGVPASSTAPDGFEQAGIDAQILEDEQSLEDYRRELPAAGRWLRHPRAGVRPDHVGPRAGRRDRPAGG